MPYEIRSTIYTACMPIPPSRVARGCFLPRAWRSGRQSRRSWCVYGVRVQVTVGNRLLANGRQSRRSCTRSSVKTSRTWSSTLPSSAPTSPPSTMRANMTARPLPIRCLCVWCVYVCMRARVYVCVRVCARVLVHAEEWRAWAACTRKGGGERRAGCHVDGRECYICIRRAGCHADGRECYICISMCL